MRKFAIIALAATAGLGLAACSEKTQENAENTMESAGQDISTAATVAGDAVEAGASAAGDAAEKAADTAKQKAAEAEADAQNEPVSKTKAD